MARYRQRRWDHQDLGSTVRRRFVISYHRKQAKITVRAPDLLIFNETTTTKLQVPSPPRPAPHFGSTLTVHSFLVNDVVVHPNQGELISCDQAGRIKQWDLSENTCTHELVSPLVTFPFTPTIQNLLVILVSDSRWRHTHAFRQPCV